MDLNVLPDDLKKAVEFHGHLCPGVMIGWRAARAAAKALDVGKSEDEELVAVAENDSCSIDAFQALLSTTMGKGNLRLLDNGKQVFTLYDRNQGRGVRVYFTGDKFKDKLPGGSPDREAYMRALLDAEDSELLTIKEIKDLPPAKARIEPSHPCARCGEQTQESKMLGLDGELFCKPCHALKKAEEAAS